MGMEIHQVGHVERKESLGQSPGEQSHSRGRLRRALFFLEEKDKEAIAQKLKEGAFQQGWRDR